MRRALILASSIALLLAAAPTPAAARGDQYTISHLTFSGPVRLPGIALAEGAYTLKRVLPGVIQVLSKDHMTLYGTFMTIPTLRTGRATKQEVVFGEASGGETPPITAWFPFPEPAYFNVNRSVGYEFLYSEKACCGQHAARVAQK